MMQGLNDLLPKNIKRAGINQQMTAVLVLEKFSQITFEMFGQKFLDQARPLYLKNGVMTVACLSPLLAQELKREENRIIESLNRQLGEKAVDSLRFLV